MVKRIQPSSPAIGAGTDAGLELPDRKYFCSLVDQEIASGNFSKLCETEFANIRGGNVHLIGLITTVQVEASLHHLQSLLKSLKESLPLDTKIFLHAILDGRDMSAKGGRHLLEDTEKRNETSSRTTGLRRSDAHPRSD
jgi:bisphosphoglycerate-independent phosphoglycerate mutase (AlkP superfamily)